MTALVIVESPNKVKKIQKYLGNGYVVAASVGHFRDLPQKEMGVAPPRFIPKYVITNKRVVSNLQQKAKNAEMVYLATDPDREGEAIAYHLREALRLKNYRRIAFHEITEKAVKASLAEAGDIDMGLVAAQEGRRVMDRLVGYRVSGPLSDRLQQRASAGRVQTPALRLVADRENEIRAFVPTDYFEVVATFDAETGRWEAKWDSKPYLKAGQDYFQDEAFANSVATLREFTVQDISTKPVTRKPPPPFISSTLIQAASSQLKIKPKKAMQLAQELFEAALITYHRTDTPNLSDEAVGMVWDWLRQNGKDNYIPPAANKWKAKGGAQEAHEAIRPTDFSNREANNVSSDAARLYDLIWRRAVASQMKPACFDETSIHLRSTQTTNDGRQQDFHAKGRVMTFNGWMALGADNKQSQQLPSLSGGAVITSSDTMVKAKRTQPPKRYTEATLVKKLEDSEIGRPSTYASIMETLTSRHYVREHKEGKGKQVYLAPTPLGEKIIAALAGGFSFADYEFTRQVEAHLDKIAAGEERYIDVVARINDTLDNELGKMPTPEGVEQHECPECGKPLRLRNGKRGAFWGCTGYPDCKYTAPDDGGKPGQRAPEPKPASDKTYDCPVCSKPLRLRNGQRGAFWGCTGYPDCNYLVDDNQGVPALPDKIYPCPECSKPMRRINGRKGPFWSCSGYPACRHAVNDLNGAPEGIVAAQVKNQQKTA